MPGEGPQPALRDGQRTGADVMRYLSDQPVEACPPSAGTGARSTPGRNRAVLAMASVVSLALIAGTTISVRQAIRATKAEKRMAGALDLAKEQHLRLADEHRSQAERHLYATRLRFAQQSLESGQLDRAREILAALESQPDSFMGGEFAWRYVRARAWGMCSGRSARLARRECSPYRVRMDDFWPLLTTKGRSI